MHKAIDIVGLTDTGQVRGVNQDCIHMDAARGFFLLADGVGGGPGGEVASRLTVDTLIEHLTVEMGNPWYRFWGRSDRDRLAAMKAAVSAAHKALRARVQSAPQLEGMASTLLACVLSAGRCLCVATGDSRVYTVSGPNVKQVTEDQTLANQLLNDGYLQAADAKLHKYSHVLTHAVGGKDEPQVQSHVIPLRDNEVLLACSDGLSGMLSDELIGAVIHAAGSLGESAHRLVAEANDAGGKDNISVILANARGRGFLPLRG